MSTKKIRVILWLVVSLLIFASIGLMYYVFIVKQEYDIFTLPDGPDTSDYFEE